MKVKEGKSQAHNLPIAECLGVDCRHYTSQQHINLEYCLAYQESIADIKECKCYDSRKANLLSM